MNVRWSAVLRGWLVDFIISLLIQTIVFGLGLGTFFDAPDLARPSDDLILALLLLSTGIGGYVAGRLARQSHVFNGFMVGVVGIVIGVILNAGAPPLPHVFVFGQIAGCGMGALGGYLSSLSTRADRRPPTTDR